MSVSLLFTQFFYVMAGTWQILHVKIRKFKRLTFIAYHVNIAECGLQIVDKLHLLSPRRAGTDPQQSTFMNLLELTLINY
jgi:hypothetical protein